MRGLPGSSLNGGLGRDEGVTEGYAIDVAFGCLGPPFEVLCYVQELCHLGDVRAP